MRQALTPDYSFGCKRPTFSNTYYPSFTRDNVDLETTSIERITPTGITTTDGRETEIDVLVLATGFDMWDANFPAISVIGRDGKDLGKWWRSHPLPGLPGHRGAGLPQLPEPGVAVLLLRPVVLHDHRGPDEAHRPVADGGTPPRGHHLRGQATRANEEFLGWVTERLDDSVFSLGQCATARSYYFNQHGEAALLRPSSTINTHKEAASFPVEDYAYS